MYEENLPRKILECCPPGRRIKGRLRNSWVQEVTTGMREKGINNLEWVDREDRRREKTLGTERCENIKTPSVHKQIIIIINKNNKINLWLTAPKGATPVN